MPQLFTSILQSLAEAHGNLTLLHKPRSLQLPYHLGVFKLEIKLTHNLCHNLPHLEQADMLANADTRPCTKLGGIQRPKMMQAKAM